LIRLHEVSKSYAGRQVLRPASVSVGAGETLVLVGESGSGKSTLLRIAMGLILPDTGEVEIAGKRLTPGNARELRLSTGYTIQNGGLFPHLTAVQNVTLAAREVGWERKRAEDRVVELAELVALPPDALDRYPAQLSGGQRQRVGLIRALMLDPPVLLMDEPLGALDAIIRSQLQDDLKELFQRLHKAVLLVTHDLGEAAFLGDRISVMHEGRILQTGTFAELVEKPADPYIARLISAQRHAGVGV
jgi:osmoprotectant transport system ATP-binding protein